MLALTAALLLQSDLDQVKALLESGKPENRKTAYERLPKMPPKDRDAAIQHLVALDQKLRTEYEDETGALDKLVDLKKLAKTISSWEDARSKACAAIFDRSAFPDPTKAVTGPYKGHDKVKGKMSDLESKYEPIGKLVDAVLEKKPAEAVKGADARAAWIEEIADVLGKYGKAPGAFRRWSEPLWQAIAKFDGGDLEGGKKIYDALPASEKKLLFFFYCRGFMKADAGGKMDEKSIEGVRALNALRMKLGIPPLEGDDRLTAAMVAHLGDMEKNKYFGHYEKSESTKTPQQRCDRQGYKGLTGENIATTAPAESIALWMWDGGHFRNMVNPAFQQVGFATGAAGSGFDAGTGDGAKLPRIDVPWSLPK